MATDLLRLCVCVCARAHKGSVKGPVGKGSNGKSHLMERLTSWLRAEIHLQIRDNLENTEEGWAE